MKHTIETAILRAKNMGYAGEYIAIAAQPWVGKTDSEILRDSNEFNRNFLRREKYARAALVERDPKRKAYLSSVGEKI